jgi:hypothetical protein
MPKEPALTRLEKTKRHNVKQTIKIDISFITLAIRLEVKNPFYSFSIYKN